MLVSSVRNFKLKKEKKRRKGGNRYYVHFTFVRQFIVEMSEGVGDVRRVTPSHYFVGKKRKYKGATKVSIEPLKITQITSFGLLPDYLNVQESHLLVVLPI